MSINKVIAAALLVIAGMFSLPGIAADTACHAYLCQAGRVDGSGRQCCAAVLHGGDW